jgi:hypothetical protein
MSMYNMLFGTNPAADKLLAALGTTMGDVPRFRDVYLDEDGIVIYTRTGGNNREDYEDEINALRDLPGFVSDEDDDFDNTYAYFRYAVPDAFMEEVRAGLASTGVDVPPSAKWDALFAALNAKEKEENKVSQ